MADGHFQGDIIGLRDELLEGAYPLLATVMEKGRSVGPRPTIEEIRKRFADNFNRLDDKTKRLSNPEKYPVELSERLVELQRRC
jgi:nicotinate phosphoribosyltransferase